MRYPYILLYLVFILSFLACHTNLPDNTTTATRSSVSSFPISPYLIKDSSLYEYFEIDAHGIRMYSSPIDKQTGNPEIHIYPDEYERFQQLYVHLTQDSIQSIYIDKGTRHWDIDEYRNIQNTKSVFSYGQDSLAPLKGLRIAIDPGHIAPDVVEGELEGKYVKMHPSLRTKRKPIRFNEATLTLATAYLIKSELESMGAEVLLSRTEMGKNVLGQSYKQWFEHEFESVLAKEVSTGKMTEKDANWWRTKATERDLYRRLYTGLDLKNRAKKINEFHPHLTLIIHYNIDSNNWERRDSEGFFPPTSANYCMAFVPGSFMRGELRKQEDRISFLRLLLTEDIDQSVRLTEYFIRASNRLTDVSIIPPKNKLSYLKNACILTKTPGVYARNLTLTNLIQGPLCYGESLCQDNTKEALALNKRDIEVNGITTSSRLKDVAKAYIRTVLRFARDGITPQ